MFILYYYLDTIVSFIFYTKSSLKKLLKGIMKMCPLQILLVRGTIL